MIYHVLNGDALKEQLPESISGEILVARECMVEGDVKGATPKEVFASRAKFLNQAYAVTEEEYYSKTASEYEKLNDIPDGSEINLWFEHDLFCQVNLWFVISMLKSRKDLLHLFLVSPTADLQYGFGGMKKSELLEALVQRTPLNENEIINFGLLWKAYQNGDMEILLDIASSMSDSRPLLLEAVRAHVARFPKDGAPGRPELALMNIMAELNTKEFGPVFKTFNERESIYGFGDLQVKRILDQIDTQD